MNEMATTTAATPLFARATALVNVLFSTIVTPQFYTIEAAVTGQRGLPTPYLKVASQLTREYGFKTIVEIGSMRHPLKHGLDEIDPVCCNDGHSTLFFADTGAEIFTVDVDPKCADVLVSWTRKYRNLHVYTADGIWFLKKFDRPIDVLYLDAWDVVPSLDYAQKHLDAYRAALPHLARTCLILIDDTDILNGGKGQLAIPQMIRDGFELVTWGRQAMLARG
jgi:hypothetical protein